MKSLFASALIALTFATTTFADGKKDIADVKSNFHAAVYPMVNSMKISVNVSKAKDSNVNVRLLNEAGNTLTLLKLGKENESSVIRFDLNNLEDGIYKVEISDGFKTEVKEVKLETNSPEPITYRGISLN